MTPFFEKKLEEGLCGPEGPAREEPRSGNLSSIEYDQVSDLNDEIKPHWNICDQESVKEEYNKPLPVGETF